MADPDETAATHRAIAAFQRRRWCALIGIVLPGTAVLFAFVNGTLHVVAAGVAWATVGVAVSIAAWALTRYRCPFCGRFPEIEIPLFNPRRCSHCGASLTGRARGRTSA
ncbi:MAG TPA: hypothetical protein VMQ51_20685 [Candidatus Binatia bacterium]|nr:hypothetical protein [Candidatus Binatia bacterium]